MIRRSPKRASGEEWYTPSWLLAVLAKAQAFDLDPCASPDDHPHVPATVRIAGTGTADGLTQEWAGCVFVDPQHGCGPLERWVDKALRSVYWDRTACAVVATLPVTPQAVWWVTYVRGWANVFLVRNRIRVGAHVQQPPFAAACAIWGDAAPFRTAIDAQPPSRANGVWLAAYRAESRQAPFLQSFTTRTRMQQVYGSYESFRENLSLWNARMTPEYVAITATAQETGSTGQVERIRLNREGYVTHIEGRSIFRRRSPRS